MDKPRLSQLVSDTVDRIAELACRQMAAGQLVIPRKIIMTQRTVTANALPYNSDLEFRFIFAVDTGQKNTRAENWLVVIPCEDPQGGRVYEATRINNAKVYVWDNERGWFESLEYEHQWRTPPVRDGRLNFGPYADQNPFDWPPAN